MYRGSSFQSDSSGLPVSLSSPVSNTEETNGRGMCSSPVPPPLLPIPRIRMEESPFQDIQTQLYQDVPLNSCMQDEVNELRRAKQELRDALAVKEQQLMESNKEKERVQGELWSYKITSNNQIRCLESELQNLKVRSGFDKMLKQEVSRILGQIFTPGQIDMLTSGRRHVHWSDEDIFRALKLRALSTKAYNHLAQEVGIPLPSVSTLYRWSQKNRNHPVLATLNIQPHLTDVDIAEDAGVADMSEVNPHVSNMFPPGHWETSDRGNNSVTETEYDYHGPGVLNVPYSGEIPMNLVSNNQTQSRAFNR